jgi:predicted dehydrogenase/GT2 family glycosyltransferase
LEPRDQSRHLPVKPRPALRLALVGCGEVTREKHLPALRRVPSIEVIALADLDPGRREGLARAHGIPHAVASVEAVLGLEGVDAIGVCVPPSAHAEVAVAALRAGAHVWIDKPLALDLGDCERIRAAAAASAARVVVGFHMRSHRLLARARAIVTSGALGPLESIRCTWSSPRDDVDLPAWRARRDRGGGALIEIGVHHVDLWRYLTGAEVEEVFALSRDGVRHDEHALVTARLSGGILASTALSERAPHQIEVEVTGGDARLHVDCLRFEGLDVSTHRDRPGAASTRLRRAAHALGALPEGLRVMRRGGDYHDSYRLAWEHFEEAIRTGQPARASLEDGIRAVEVTLAAHASRAQGVPVAPRGSPPAAEPPLDGALTRAARPAVLADHGPVGPAPMVTTPPGVADAQPFMSVVVPTFERPGPLATLLEALACQRLPRDAFEVIVVDDSGAGSIADIVHAFADRLDVRLLVEPHRGCAGARHAGSTRATGSHLVFIDDDCVPEPGWLLELRRACLAHPGAAVGGAVLNGLPDNPYSEASHLVVDALMERGRRGATAFFSTNNVAFPAERFREIGGMDPGWGIAGGEDRDLCWRWVRRRFPMVKADAAIVRHQHPLALGTFWRQHYHYGRGACKLRRRVGERQAGAIPFESGAFYAQLMLRPLGQHRPARALVLSALILLSQAATAAGFTRERARAARGSGQVGEAALTRDSRP